uniref:Large ribosomal subunit protein uL3c n=1 Tax=Neogoniolithon spectabile TaxID=231755 RepID=A0A3G3MGT7_9FLOR|nr:ribosomal protein L3 [Neogoniolithon spectabile]AYR06037.1 ribosomal protein L3 [Neogoniolithon spectabile]
MTSISLLGNKIGMTQIFTPSGQALAVTILRVGPCWVTQIKTKATHGYNAIQIGYLEISENKVSKAEAGHLRKLNLPILKHLLEYRSKSEHKSVLGELLSTNNLNVGDCINVTGITMGKGFTGYQKRHHFTRGPMSHGSKNHKKPGSIGAGTTPGRVFPGQKMAGQMGAAKRTVKNLEIIKIIEESHLIIVKGSVPGKAGHIISINKI